MASQPASPNPSVPLAPPRGELLRHESARAVLAAIETLDPALQHEVLVELRERLAAPELAGKDVRTRRGIAALREVATELGHSPSVTEYRERQSRPGSQLPPDSSIRRWLGGSWNECLRRAHLEAHPDGDVITIELGSRFSDDELIDAAQACARELGHVPSWSEYLGWARRPEGRAARRPLSQGPFERLGGWLGTLRAAGLLTDSGAVIGAPYSTCVRAGSYFITDEVMRNALHEVAERIGGSPRVQQYARERNTVIRDSMRAGAPRTLPACTTIQKRHGTWDAALIDAGLEPLGGRATGKRGERRNERKAPRFSDEALLAILREAWAAVGDPFSSPTYSKWRKAQVERDRDAGVLRRLPSYTTYWERFGTWEAALAAALATETTT